MAKTKAKLESDARRYRKAVDQMRTAHREGKVLEAIRVAVKACDGEVEYIADPEALQYRQSQSMSEEDAAFIEDVFGNFDDDGEEVEDHTDPVKLPSEISS